MIGGCLITHGGVRFELALQVFSVAEWSRLAATGGSDCNTWRCDSGRSQGSTVLAPRAGRELLQEGFCIRVNSDANRVEVEVPELIAAEDVDENSLGFHNLTNGRLSVSQ